jgi:hypothetical protein
VSLVDFRRYRQGARGPARQRRGADHRQRAGLPAWTTLASARDLLHASRTALTATFDLAVLRCDPCS